MIQQWGFDGYIRWLRGIKATYNMRKTWLCDTFQDVFHLEFDSGNDLFPERSRTITCYSKQCRSVWDEKRGLRGPALITFIPPTGETSQFNPRHQIDMLFSGHVCVPWNSL